MLFTFLTRIFIFFDLLSRPVLDFICLFYVFSLSHFKYELDNGDTVTSNDLVTKQYENLPYPEVSEMELINEERHYKDNKINPIEVFPSHTLEVNNHYLHRGKENFRCV